MCSGPASTEGQASSGSEQAQQGAQQDVSTINADIPEDLRWRDADFAVDPTRNEWRTGDNGRKVVYLTVDDGPSELTEKYLDVFDKYNVKATFFVTGHDPQYYDMIHEAYKRGHTIGLHSMSHDYSKVYASEEAFFAEFDEVGQVVKEQIGYVPCFIRFPGGASNTQADNYSKGLMAKLVKDVLTRGYQYYDWNVTSGDGDDVSTEQIIETIKGSELDTNIVVLCHDSATKQTTLEALPTIIEYYQKLGYSFEAMNRDTMVCHHLVDLSTSTSDESSSASDDEGAGDGDSENEGDDASSYDEGYDDEGYDVGAYEGESYADDETFEGETYEEEAFYDESDEEV